MKKAQLKSLLLLIACTAFILFGGCKKKKEAEPYVSQKASTYFIKATVNGSLIDMKEGVNNYRALYDNISYSDGGSGLNLSYGFSLRSPIVTNAFELDFNLAHISDGEDFDDIKNFFVTGLDTLHKDEPRFDLTYTENDLMIYTLDAGNDTSKIYIDKVTDIGRQNIEDMFGEYSSRRVIEVEGRIPAARLYEYSVNDDEFGSEYVDIENLTFVVRYVSSN